MHFSEDLIAEVESVIKSLVDNYKLRDSKPLSTESASSSTELGLDNILGFGLGEKIVGGHPQGRAALCGYVVRKAPAREVRKGYLIDDLGQRDELKKLQVATDVIEMGRPSLFHHRKRQYDPRVPAGVAIASNVGGPPGTLGVWLTDGHEAYLLTCWHCIDGGHGIAGTTLVQQPSGGKDIATLFASVDPRSCPAGTVTIDAAIAKALSATDTENFILQIGETRGTKKVTTTYYPVMKSGAITHRTDGGIVNVSGSMHLTDPRTGSTIFYERQLVIQPNPAKGPFAAPGDSGALVLSSDHYAVGLFVGGTSLPPSYIATPINTVLAELMRVGSLPRLNIVVHA